MAADPPCTSDSYFRTKDGGEVHLRYLLTITLSLAVMLSPQVSQAADRGPCYGPSYEVKHGMTTDEQHDNVRALIRCATSRWDVPGGYEQALQVATCESSLYSWAESNGNYGLYQIRDWSSHAHTYLERDWFPFHWLPRWQLARANVLVTVRWAHQLGWGAWSCA